jgi:membrane protease YdiL (CAAX protease family)
MYDLHKRHPWLIGSGSMLIFLIVALIGTPVGNQLESWARLPLNSGILIQQVLLVIVAALAVTFFGGWREAGFARPMGLRAWLYAVPPLLCPIFLLFFSGIVVRDPVQIVMLIALTALVGFAEEALCRGMIAQAFLSRGVMKAAIYSSLIFGFAHMIQVFYGSSIGMGLLYSVYAGLVGFGFAAPYLRSGGAIWPVIVVHGLYDFLGKMGHGWGAAAQPTTSFETVVRLVAAVLIALYGFWLLRRQQSVSSETKETGPIALPAH